VGFKSNNRRCRISEDNRAVAGCLVGEQLSLKQLMISQSLKPVLFAAVHCFSNLVAAVAFEQCLGVHILTHEVMDAPIRRSISFGNLG